MPSNITPMFYFTYVLYSLRDGKHYIGYTNNLKNRLAEHYSGKSFSTAPRRPLRLIYFEACLDQEDARQREKYLKQTVGRRYLSRRLRSYRRKSGLETFAWLE